MAKKKAASDIPDDLKALEAKVDAMMDPRPQQKSQSTTDVAVSPDDLKQQIAANIGLPKEEVPEAKLTIQSVATPVATTAPELPGAAPKSKAKASKQSKPVKVVDPKPVEPQPEAAPQEPEPEPSEDAPEQTASDAETATVEAATSLEPQIELEGTELDAAVDDIVVEEADTVLAVEDARRGHKARQADAVAKPQHPLASILWTALLIALLIGIVASLILVVLYGS